MNAPTYNSTYAPPPLRTTPGFEHHFIEANGARMHSAFAGETSAEPVLLMHGFPQHWWQWHNIALRLGERYRAICPDLRGAGWTTAPEGGYRRELRMNDILALLDQLGLERVHVVSHDMGTITANQLCYRHPERVISHLALAVPPPFFEFPLRMLPAMRQLWFEEALAVPGLGPALLARKQQRLARWLFSHFTARQLPVDAVEEYIAPLRSPQIARASSALCRHMVLPELARMMGGSYRRERLKTPTLLLFGSADAVFPPKVAMGIEDYAAKYADDLRVRIVPGAAHFISDEAPDEVAEIALEFFATAHPTTATEPG